ncbi:MAG TPA: ABC transporter ATP-binding protein [Thermoanaerobaculia bacterium]|jgi:ATP-binding cassette subfamily B protein|nr:ABC transporter ATP-binding protein [Thermoanaerobaculia bacterium]
MQLLAHYLSRQKRLLTGALVLATINQVFSLLDPQVFRLIVDRYATKVAYLTRQEFVHGVLLLLLAYVGVALVSRIAKNFQDYSVNVIAQRVGAQLYERSVSHSFSLPYSVFEDQRSGEILQKMQKARSDAQSLITNFINMVFVSLVGLLFVTVYAFTVHWSIGLVYLLLAPVLGTLMFYISRRIKTQQRVIVTQTAELAGATTETLRNVELVKSLGLEGQEIARLNSVNAQILDLELKKVRFLRFYSFLQGTTINTTRAGLLFLMLWLNYSHAITLGQFFSLFFYSFAVFSPLAELGAIIAQYQEAKASMEKLEEVLEIEPAPKPAQPVPLGPLTSVDFLDVSFTYPSASTPSLEGVNLHIEAGDTVAFVGPSGSGKTSLVKLLVGLYQPTSGQLAVNETDASLIDPDALRARIGLVTQDTQLFAGTIRDNLLFVNPRASDAECIEVLRQASALPIIERGGKGLDTKIGEGGIKISGGERQRLAIARALLRQPELMIFDEATSSLDSITERAITETIRGLTSGQHRRMTVLVAHRLSTIQHAQHIYVLAKGRVVETGTHTSLLGEGGLYAALWREQSARSDAVAA